MWAKYYPSLIRVDRIPRILGVYCQSNSGLTVVLKRLIRWAVYEQRRIVCNGNTAGGASNHRQFIRKHKSVLNMKLRSLQVLSVIFFNIPESAKTIKPEL